MTLDVEQRMEFVIAASRRNICEKTGGPFAAAVFESHTGRLVSLGVNLVETRGLSVLHAEIVALMLAQRKLRTWDLGGDGVPDHDLFTSTEPCAMCLGSIPWSGIRSVVMGARDEDARSIGFDEGEKPEGWAAALSRRGIRVLRDVRRGSARSVLDEYREKGVHVYSSRETRADA